MAANPDTAAAKTEDEALSRTELLLEQEKLRLERERLLLEQERLSAARDRLQSQSQISYTASGKLKVTVSTLILVSIISALTGGILGAFSTSMHITRQQRASLQRVMDSLAVSERPETEVLAEDGSTVTNLASEMPAWLKSMKPRESHSGISLVVIQ
ncbi:MAG: hypothetical protein IJU44_07805 [Kiritimatiellae bacterium]|nr:hypothetical protein [Kiritimatiellia bacterium]